jgi:hypothetical protein
MPLKYFFKMLEVDMIATHCYGGVDKQGEILERTDALNDVYHSGLKLGEP